MARKPLTSANIAASRERTRKTQKKLKKRRESLGKRSRAKERETDIKTKQFAAQQAEVERKAAEKVKAQKAAAAKATKPAIKKPITTAAEALAAAPKAEEKPKGFSNVIDVLGIALNPFSEDKIIATTGNKVFNTAAEYVANAPYVAALILTGIGGAIKTAAKATGGIPITRLARSPAGILVRRGTEFTQFEINSSTAKLTASLLSNVAASKKWTVLKYAAIAGTIGTYPWAEWALGEAKEGMIFNVNKAVKTGDVEVIKLMREQQEEIFEITAWENIQRLIPYANLAFGFGQKAKALQAQWKVNDKILADEIVNLESGEPEEDEFERGRREQERINKEKHEMEIAAIDHYNEEAQRIRKLKEEAEDRDMKEDAKFWRKEEEKRREREAEDRQAIADFWMAYSRTKQKIANDSRPSNLNFGLL